METQTDIFNIQEEAVYCFDASTFLNLLKVTDDEPYAMDVMEGAYEYIQAKMRSGKIISSIAVYNELRKHEKKVPNLKEWLKENKHCFIDEDLAFSEAMRPIVKEYEIYTTDKGDYGDISIISLAKSRNLTVVTAEKHKDQHRKIHPKIPNVCEEFDVESLTMIGFLRKEGVVLKLSSASEHPIPIKETAGGALRDTTAN